MQASTLRHPWQRFLAVLAAAAAFPLSSAVAQPTLVPGVSSGYLGLNLGRAKFDPNCVPGFGCDSAKTGYKFTAGGQTTDVLGAEFGFIDFGKIDVAGGNQRARGVNLSLVGTLPVGVGFSAFGKLGATYGWTDTRSSAPGVATGTDRGIGLSYGLGVGYRVTSRVEVIAEYERHRMDFAPGDQTLGFTSIGVRLRY